MSSSRNVTPVVQVTGDNTKEIHAAEDLSDGNINTTGNETSASFEAKPETCKENQAPDHSKPPMVQPDSTRDYQKEFGEWKGSSNPSCPKWAGPPYLHGPSAPDNDAGASSGPCPGMGIWGSQ
ncbi:hypothetical protein VMCG_09494 [Cytospora schulzeri]|uniref:Uncharacterized protein n=1 Tax=Cytospora schulzeri TaxID=448051 RepID=A0A423VFX5_9PEZI|nr:hypothetical protein VMCG_09494 [Valsa malicola]